MSMTAPNAGWIISNADETKFRFWDALGPTWTTNRVKALRFARRIDAERFSAEDEDAWKILPYGEPDFHDDLVAHLHCAIGHIEHMAAWIGEQRAGYSFESLGEDMPDIRAALSRAKEQV
jgi:hypothetical protein